jgi:hypothetical protein
MYGLPGISIGERAWALPCSGLDGLDLLGALAETDETARGIRWRRLLRQAPTLLIWCLSRRRDARDIVSLARGLAVDARPELVALTAENSAAAFVPDANWITRLVDYWQALAVATHAAALAAVRRQVALAALGANKPVIAVAAEPVSVPAPTDSRPRRCLESLLSGIWPGPPRDFSPWLGRLFHQFDFGWHPTESTDPSALSPTACAARIECWRNDSGLDPTVVSVVCRQLEKASRAASDWEREKLASLKQLAYGASHEINNPLANIATRAQLLLPGEIDPARRKHLRTIYGQAMRAHEMISDMMLFAHPPFPEFQPINLSAVIHQAIDDFEQAGRPADWTIDRILSSAIDMRADAGQLIAVIQSLLRNAVESQPRGRIEVALSASDDDTCEIEVRDDGPGLSEAAARHLFDPFFSGREAGRGLGFGLSKAWTIVQLHGGDIQVANTGPAGTTIRIGLPRVTR